MILFTIIMIVLVSSLLRPRPLFWHRPYYWRRPMMFGPRMHMGPRMHRPPMGMHGMGPRRF